MTKRLPLSILIVALSLAAAACDDTPRGAAGDVGLSLSLAPGDSIATASYTISGPAGFSRNGAINLGSSATLSLTLGGIPSGAGYNIAVTAVTTDGGTTCAGSATFDVVAHQTAMVTVHVACHEAARRGTVRVDGTFNVCPVLDGVSASPREVFVGSTIALSATAHDTDHGPAPLAYHWTASAGALGSADAAATSFTCQAPGTATVTISVSDGDPVPGCADSLGIELVCSVPGSGGPIAPSTVAVYGDAPYGTTPTDTAEFVASPAFIANVNADPDVSLVMHVGDIHSGKQFCTEAYDRSIFDLWTAFADPLVYTPGDNEWIDCNKAAEGGGTYNATTGQIEFMLDASGNQVDFAGGDPLANLALVRSIFFSHPGLALGGGAMPVFSQAQLVDLAHPMDASFVENAMWEQSGVLFVAINLPGGSNNDNDVWYGAPTPTAAQSQEIADRTGADLRWLDLAFAQAAADGAVAVVIQAQADMWDPEKGAVHQTAFEPFVLSIASHTTAFGKPVLMFNGDSHVYLSHNPLSPSDTLYFMHPSYDVPNFHRIVVHGSTFPLEWLKLSIDPAANAPVDGPDGAFGPFSWTRVIP